MNISMFHEMVETLRKNKEQFPVMENGIFRGIMGTTPGFWTLAGVTKNAMAHMEAAGWTGNYTKGLRRDHIKPVREFQYILMSREHSYDEFVALVKEYGQCVLCTKAENPSKGAGYGVTYTDADVIWIDAPFDTVEEISVRATKARAALFKNNKIAA